MDATRRSAALAIWGTLIPHPWAGKLDVTAGRTVGRLSAIMPFLKALESGFPSGGVPLRKDLFRTPVIAFLHRQCGPEVGRTARSGANLVARPSYLPEPGVAT